MSFKIYAKHLHFLKSRISFYKYYIANEPNILNEIVKFIDMTISSQNYLKFSFFPCGWQCHITLGFHFILLRGRLRNIFTLFMFLFLDNCCLAMSPNANIYPKIYHQNQSCFKRTFLYQDSLKYIARYKNIHLTMWVTSMCWDCPLYVHQLQKILSLSIISPQQNFKT